MARAFPSEADYPVAQRKAPIAPCRGGGPRPLVEEGEVAHHRLDFAGSIGAANGLRMPNNSRGAMSRRALLAGGAALPRTFAQPQEPLRIGFLTVRTGPLAAGGRQQEEGAALFLKERDATI